MRARGLGLLSLCLAGCSVGPKYTKPAITTPPAYKEADGWKTAQPGDQQLRGPWWEIFGDTQLNTLEEQVSVSNQDLRAAEARYREARAMIRVNRASQFPTITTQPSVSTLRDSSHRPYFPANEPATGDFVLPFDLSYELDLWGRVRKTVAAAREEAHATAADLETASLSLHAELAMDYFELRSADAQKQLLDDTVKAYGDALRLTKNRYEGGAPLPSRTLSRRKHSSKPRKSMAGTERRRAAGAIRACHRYPVGETTGGLRYPSLAAQPATS